MQPGSIRPILDVKRSGNTRVGPSAYICGKSIKMRVKETYSVAGLRVDIVVDLRLVSVQVVNVLKSVLSGESRAIGR